MHCKKCILHRINFHFSIIPIQYKQTTFLKVRLESFCLRNAHQYKSISALIINWLAVFCFSQRFTSGIPLYSLGIKACNQACNVQFWKHLCIALFFSGWKLQRCHSKPSHLQGENVCTPFYQAWGETPRELAQKN